ncbi:4-coumarate--CoA ligase [Colletotrichum asianum]
MIFPSRYQIDIPAVDILTYVFAYLDNPSARRENLTEDGWLKTGDVVKFQRNGLLTIVDRKKAHIVPAKENLDMESIVDFMDHRLAAYKRLTGGVVFTKAIPKSGSGKILRRLIQDPEAAPWPCDG